MSVVCVINETGCSKTKAQLKLCIQQHHFHDFDLLRCTISKGRVVVLGAEKNVGLRIEEMHPALKSKRHALEKLCAEHLRSVCGGQLRTLLVLS